MTDTEKYLNFVNNYNQALKNKKTSWLSSSELGEVLIETVEQNCPGGINSILQELSDSLSRSDKD